MTLTEKMVMGLYDLYRNEPANVILDADELPYDDVNPNCLAGIELYPEAEAKLNKIKELVKEIERRVSNKKITFTLPEIKKGKIGPNALFLIKVKTNALFIFDTKVIKAISEIIGMADDLEIDRAHSKMGFVISFSLFDIWKKYIIVDEEDI